MHTKNRMNTETITLSPDLLHSWATSGIVSRFFVDPDTCEEVVKGHEDKVFIQVRVTPTKWQLTSCRRAKPYHPAGGKANPKKQYE